MMKGQDLTYELALTLEEAAASTTKVISYREGGKQETVSVKVPAGISAGKKLRLPGKAQPAPMAAPTATSMFSSVSSITRFSKGRVMILP